MIHSQFAGAKPPHWDSAAQDYESLQLLPPGVKPGQLFFGCGQLREQFVGLGGVGAMKIRRHKQTFDPRYLLLQSQNLRLDAFQFTHLLEGKLARLGRLGAVSARPDEIAAAFIGVAFVVQRATCSASRCFFSR